MDFYTEYNRVDRYDKTFRMEFPLAPVDDQCSVLIPQLGPMKKSLVSVPHQLQRICQDAFAAHSITQALCIKEKMCKRKSFLSLGLVKRSPRGSADVVGTGMIRFVQAYHSLLESIRLKALLYY